jgi:hypothetical protein
MADETQIIAPPDVSATLDQLHGLYGRDQSLPAILEGLNKRLGHARILYGPGRSEVVNGLYRKLDRIRQLYGSEHIEDVLDDIIERKEHLNRVVELQSKVMLSADELAEFHSIRQQFKLYVANLARQKAQERMILTKIGQR